MKDFKVKIDGLELQVKSNQTIMDAAMGAGISIPALCYKSGFEHSSACMICVVEEMDTGKLLPSCSALVKEGMNIQTRNKKVKESRQEVLELLFAEHHGDCQAPCQNACPAKLNIPLMIRQIGDCNIEEAIKTIKQAIPLPAVLGRICSAPCEKACRRSSFDQSLAICDLKRYTADQDLFSETSFQPEPEPSTEKTVGIIGGGPAGLSTAYFLSLRGHSCKVFDQNDQPGGRLRKIESEILPQKILNKEISKIKELGVDFITGPEKGRITDFKEIIEKFDAVVICTGNKTGSIFESSDLGFKMTEKGIWVEKNIYQSSTAGVFACGNCLFEGKIPIRSLADGKETANSVDQYLKGNDITGILKRVNSKTGKPDEEDIKVYLDTAEDYGRIEHSEVIDDEIKACRESKRCWHCDCRGVDDCRLRQYGDEYQVNPQKKKFKEKKKFIKKKFTSNFVYESGKCIKCGLCTQVLKKAKNVPGLAIINRGFEMDISIPFDMSLDEENRTLLSECIENCPTGALYFENQGENK